MHQDKRHGKSLITRATSGSRCPVCAIEWWTTYRLREHLRRDASCRTVWNESDLPAAETFELTGCRAKGVATANPHARPSPVLGHAPAYPSTGSQPSRRRHVELFGLGGSLRHRLPLAKRRALDPGSLSRHARTPNCLRYHWRGPIQTGDGHAH